MNADEAVTRALRIRDEIMKRETTPAITVEERAALIISATLFQTIDWLEDKLERIVTHLPES